MTLHDQKINQAKETPQKQTKKKKEKKKKKAFLVTQMVKNLSAMQKTWVRSLGQKYPLENGMGTHSSILAWRIPQGSLANYNKWGCKELDMTERLSLSFRCNSLSILSWESILYFLGEPCMQIHMC